MPDNRVIEFLKELRDLLEDYRASIGICHCEGIDEPNLCFDVGDEAIHCLFGSTSGINRVDVKEAIEKLREKEDV